MSDMRGTGSAEAKTGNSTMTIEIGDENNHPHGPGHKDIFVFKYDFKGKWVIWKCQLYFMWKYCIILIPK